MHAKADEATSQSAFIRVHFLGFLLLHYLMNAASIVKTKHAQCFYTPKSNPSLIDRSGSTFNQISSLAGDLCV
jgi:hypothetical protein